MTASKAEVTLRLVAHDLYKLDRYLDSLGLADPNVRKAVKRVLKNARAGFLLPSSSTGKVPDFKEV